MFTLKSALISRRIINLAVFSSGIFISSMSWAVNTGPVCNNVNSPAFNATTWLQAQENVGGHTIACHIGKSDGWLQTRTATGQVSCPRVPTATTWSDAQSMWNSIHQDVIAFCAATDAGPRVSRTITLPGQATSVVGRGYSSTAPVGTFNVNGNQRAVLVYQQTGSDWFMLTTYPRQ